MWLLLQKTSLDIEYEAWNTRGNAFKTHRLRYLDCQWFGKHKPATEILESYR